jgi:hypothetical protein
MDLRSWRRKRYTIIAVVDSSRLLCLRQKTRVENKSKKPNLVLTITILLIPMFVPLLNCTKMIDRKLRKRYDGSRNERHLTFLSMEKEEPY